MYSDYPEIYDLLSGLSVAQIQVFREKYIGKIKSKDKRQVLFFDGILKQIENKISPDISSQNQLIQELYSSTENSGETFRYLLKDCRKKLFEFLDEYYSFSENSDRQKCQNQIHTAFYLIQLNQAQLAEKYWNNAKTIAVSNQMYDLYPSLAALEIQGNFEFQSELLKTVVKEAFELYQTLKNKNENLSVEYFTENELVEIISKSKNLLKAQIEEKNYIKYGKEVLAFYNYANNGFGKTLDFVRDYKGTIGQNLQVYMHLEAKNGKINGFYSYLHVGATLTLEGTINELGEIEFFEYNATHTRTGEFTGKLCNNRLEGKWRKPLQEPLNFCLFLIDLDASKPENAVSPSYFHWFFHRVIQIDSTNFSLEKKIFHFENNLQSLYHSGSEIFNVSLEILQRLEILHLAQKENRLQIADLQKNVILEKLSLYGNNPILKQSFEYFLFSKINSISAEFDKPTVKDSFIRFQLNKLIFYLHTNIETAQNFANELIESKDFNAYELDLLLLLFAINKKTYNQNIDNEIDKLRKKLKKKGSEVQKEILNNLIAEKNEFKLSIENPLQEAIITIYFLQIKII